MELYAALLHVAALLSLAGSPRGDDVTPTSCDGNVYEPALRCVSMDRASLDHIHGIDTLEGHKAFFKNLCDRKHELPGCLAPVTRASQACGDETEHRFYLMFRDLLESLPEVVCAHDGETLAKAFMTYNNSDTPSFRSDRFHDCVDTAVTRIVRLMHDAISLHTRFFIGYRALANCRECFGEIDEGDVALTREIASLLDQVVGRLKCMHPRDETPVPCRDIDVDLPGVPRACPITSPDETLLREGITWCLSTFLDEQALNAVDRLEAAWEFVVHSCRKKESIKRCMSQLVTLSSVCLSEAHSGFTRLVDDVVGHGLDSLCVVDGGYSVGYVLYKALSRPGATLRHNAIRECFTLARPHREVSSTSMDPADFLGFYQELGVFKGCLVKKMHGDNRAVFDALFFLSSVERKMPCADPERGTTVLCEHVDPTSPTEDAACPLVGRRDAEPPTYERLVDMSILCLKAATVALDPVKTFTTLEQFQTFFQSFCPNRPAVKRCLGDVTALSRACLTGDDQKLLSIFNGLYGSALDSGCQRDGEDFATVLYGLWVDVDHSVDFALVQTCMNATSEQVANYVIDTVSNRTVFHYQMLVELAQCILNGTSDAGSFRTLFATLTDELLGGLKCVHPDDGMLVTCKSFVH